MPPFAESGFISVMQKHAIQTFGFWQQLLLASGANDASGLGTHPFLSIKSEICKQIRGTKTAPSSTEVKIGTVAVATAARVYYDPSRLQSASDVLRSITRCAAVAAGRSGGETFLTLVSGRKMRGPLDTEALPLAGLSTHAERCKARGRVICCWGQAFAKGGFPNDERNPYSLYSKGPVNVLFLHQVVPQLDHPLLEGGAVVFVGNDLGAKTIDPGAVLVVPQENVWFLPKMFKSMVEADLRILFFAASNESKWRARKLWLKLPPLAAAVYTYLPFGASLKHAICVRYFAQALSNIVIEQAPFWSTFLAALELPDFTPNHAYALSEEARAALSKHRIFLVSGRKQSRDILDLEDRAADEKRLGSTNFEYAVAVGGNALALPGNHKDYVTLESMVANNSNFRSHACWLYNPSLIDWRNYIPAVPPAAARPIALLKSVSPPPTPPTGPTGPTGPEEDDSVGEEEK